MNNPVKYEILLNKEGDTAPFQILEGKFQGFVYRYKNVKIEEKTVYDEAKLSYNYVLLEVPESYEVIDEPSEQREFETVIGDILVDVITTEVSENDRESDTQ